jgi:hypothetical protein
MNALDFMHADLTEALSMRFWDVLSESDPVVALLVSDFARWWPNPKDEVVWFEFEEVPAGIVSESIEPAVSVLGSIAKRCLGPSWCASCTWEAKP